MSCNEMALEYVRNFLVRNGGSFPGKLACATTDAGDCFLIHFNPISRDEENTFLSCVNSFFWFSAVTTYSLIFAGAMGAPPSNESLLLITYENYVDLSISQLCQERDGGGIVTGFKKTEEGEEGLSLDSHLNLMREPTTSIHFAMLEIQKAKKCPERYILQGL